MADPWNTPAEDYSDLDNLGGTYAPQHAFKPGIDTLPDGSYDLEIESATLDRVNADRVARVGLKIAGGTSVEWTVWLSRQEGVNGFCADLAVLGFDTDKWGPANNRLISVELPKAVSRLKGIRFRGSKTHREGKGTNLGKVYHELRVLCRLDSRPMPPVGPTNGSAAPHPAQTPQTPAAPVRSPASAPVYVDDSDCPF